MKIKLVFRGWYGTGKFILYSADLEYGHFHRGVTFDGEIKLNPYEEAELKKTLKAGFQPCFWIRKAHK